MVDPVSCVESARAELSNQLKESKVELKVSLEENLPRITMDGERIQHALTNLLTNAIKYSPENSTVELNIERERDRVRFSVRDEGPGIHPRYQKRIFDKFYKIPSAATRPGSGLGLSIAKEFIVAHEGEIGLTSEPGKGSCFYFLLPVSLSKNESEPR